MALTARQAAKRIGCAYSTITLHCRQMGITRDGRDYLLDDDQVEALRERIRDRRGRPAEQERSRTCKTTER